MSDVYAIKETTLTALGDAIRSKVAPGVITFQEEFSVDLGKVNRKITISAENQAPLYRYELINGFVDGSLVSNSFYISDENDNNVYQEPYPNSKPIRTEHFPIILTIPSPTITIYFSTSYSSVHCLFDVIITPLDKNGNEFKYTPLEMVDAINEFNTIPEEAFALTGDCKYRFGGGWDWFLEQYGDKITTKDITSVDSMFQYSNVSNIPFDINLKSGTTINLNAPFNNCKHLTSLPNFNNCKLSAAASLFQSCQRLREIPDDYGANWDWSAIDGATTSYSASMSGMFQNCYSLRKLPKELLKHYNPRASYSYLPYYSLAYYCYALDEIVDLPVYENTLTSNAFSNTMSQNIRVKDFIFQVNEDGTPFVRQWKSQTIDCSVGYGGKSNIINYNSGITADKEVKDDTTYQALKNDPDWFSADINYSRYNHDSAVRTINSLPDTSAYGTNTIKFKGASGAKTDGGAINTLTEEEIAVATAKGWTVSLV